MKVVHCKKEAYDIYIGRPGPWGNPFSYKDNTLAEYKVSTREECVSEYEKWLLKQPDLIEKVKLELKGKILGCWCAPYSCHGDILIKIANGDK